MSGYRRIALIGVDGTDASFEALRNDAVSLRYDVELVNTTLPSPLHEKGILPYQAMDDFLGRPPLGAVVVPTTARERDAILNNLWLWDQPAFAPFLHMQRRAAPRLVFCFNNEGGRALEPEIRRAFDESRNLKTHFAGLDCRYLSLHGTDDLYVRDNAKPIGIKGHKAGPNNQFFDTIESASGLGTYILFMETDCMPIRADWVGQLQDMLRNGDPVWIIGSL